MSSLIGRTLGRYQILDVLGEGGMGVVYRALDTKLERQVAVKVLREAATSDARKIERFEREARAVARLSHPHILAIYDFGHEDGVNFAVMELLQGQNLRNRLREGRIPIQQIVRITREAAAGLGAAHAQGVIHRDIKPENIFLTAGGVKLLDFGVAHLRQTAPHAQDATEVTDALTETGTVVGTLSYMSPEQIRGAEVHAQGDIFSLGCVVYEMVAGRQPFRGETPADSVAAILQADPEPLAELRPDVPAALDQVVTRCLAKKQEDRFESARDVAFALEAISESEVAPPRAPVSPRSSRRRTLWIAAAVLLLAIAGAAVGIRLHRAEAVSLPEQMRLAVFQLESSTDDSIERQLAVGLTETVAAGLGLLEEQTHGRLWLVPEDLLDGEALDRPRVAHREFNTNLGIEGRLQVREKEWELSLDLVDGASGRLLRSTTITDDPGNLSAFQKEPVLRLAELLQIEPSQQTLARLAADSTTMAGAFEPYVRGLGLLTGGADELDAAIDLLRQAVAADPLYAPAREALAEACRRKFLETRDASWIEDGIDVIEPVLARAPEASTYRILASLNEAAGRTEERLAALQQAAELTPANAQASFDLGLAYLSVGRNDDARRALQRAINLRPGFWLGHSWLAYSYYLDGEYDAAANEFRQAIACAPENPKVYNNLGGVLYGLGRVDEARELFEKSIEVEPVNNYLAYSNLGTINFYAARYADAAAMYTRALEHDASDYVIWGHLGFARAYGADPQGAEGAFRRAISIGENGLEEDTADAELLSDLASYHAMIGERERSLELQQAAIARGPDSPSVMVTIGETFEVLGDREQALAWLGRALQAGMEPSELEDRPALRALVAEKAYIDLVGHSTSHSDTVAIESR